MKLTSRLLLPALIGAASATSDAKVYLFQGHEWPSTSKPPTLSPEEARLVFAQRLGISQYHGIGDASESAIAHINTFGGRQESIFQDSARDKAAELVLVVQGVSSKTAEPLLSAWSSIAPAFTISNPPASKSNLRFVEDLQRQVGQGRACVLADDINPFNHMCWNGRMTKAIHLNLSTDSDVVTDLMDVQERLITFAKNSEMNVMVALMPESGSSKSSKPYGSYEMPSQVPIGRRQVEEPMTDLPVASSTAFASDQVTTSNASAPFEPITGVPPVCHTSLDLCTSSTNECSGHGECYLKYAPTSEQDKTQPCYTCGCVPTEEHFLEGRERKPAYRITYWGGAACQKKDVSGPFWLFAIFTVVMVGLISWSVGLLFSVGEEKLPGVIGAGVPSKSR
ncbi:putative endoplasmic reticulum membrane [Hyphodiscus hymeniophilus]|uniref:Endoplasmic reticulum membrane n=1 Tax=Hyphodiscus hymeniophilus TaxID=353542 RepID=A0A9P6VNK1_9HELO|nr:putative endoplasmic reticulum membrane [Hyphodiscus hymeniophilus]